MKKLALLSAILIAFVEFGTSQTIPDSALYLGQTPPGDTPVIFGEGIVSMPSRSERVIAFSPKGNELFFAIGNWPTRKSMHMEYKDGAWTTSVIASFSADRSAEEPFFSLDGNRVYYYAYKPGSSSDPNICYSEKVDGIWSLPIELGAPLNTTGEEYHPNIVADGSMYFANTAGKTFRSQFNNGQFEERVMLPSNVNPTTWCDHYVNAEETYTIFCSAKAGGFGGSDLYISFRNGDGSWATPQNLGNKINTNATEMSADVSPDGKYLTFDRNGDIYWVSIQNTIDSLFAISDVTATSDVFLKENEINVFPNPSTRIFNIALGDDAEKVVEYTINSLDGKKIYFSKEKCTSNLCIDLSNTMKGVYILNLKYDGVQISTKLFLN